MRFTITFHGPFHVATGTPELGVDRSVDRENPLPATSLKGLMRAAASEQLGLRDDVVDAVFGEDPTRQGRARSPLAASPWWWSDAEFAGAPVVTNTTQIRIDDESGVTRRGFVMFGEHVWAEAATFDVEQREQVDDLDLHELVLRGAARAVVSLGGLRRKGEGWVTVSGDPWSLADTTRLLALRKES